MTNITYELIEKAKTAKSAEELLAIAKENGVEITEEESKVYFGQLNVSGPLSDDELDSVTGGGICRNTDNTNGANDGVRLINVRKCKYCGQTTGLLKSIFETNPDKNECAFCNKCGRMIDSFVNTSKVMKL